MKKIKTIGLALTMFLGILTSAQGQTTTTAPTKETKRQLVENLIGARNFLAFASNSEFSEDTKSNAFKWAITYYTDYKKAYEKLKTTLPADTKTQLDGVMNVYGQICTQEGYKYLTDVNTATALAICFAKIEKITEGMLK